VAGPENHFGVLAGGAETTFRQVTARLRDLGLNFAAWSREGQGLSAPNPPCDFCRAIYPSGDAPCVAAWRERMADGCCEDKPGWFESQDGGCCILCVPIRQRRRIAGAAVACYPTTRWLDEEFLARRCGALEVDAQVVATLARQTCRHDVGDVEDLLRIFEWCMEGEQSLGTANNELVTLSTNLSSTYEELSLLYSISSSMKVTQQPEEFLRDVCEQLREVMNVASTAAIVLAHPPAAQEDVVVVDGDLDLTPRQVKRLASTRIAPFLAQNNRAIVDNQFIWQAEPHLSKRIRNLTAAPMVNERCLGMLLAVNKNGGDFNSADMKLIGSITNQSAVFLANNMLYADLQDLLMGVLHALTASIDAKDPYTCGHSNRVAIISRRLAEMSGLSPDKVQQIYLTGLLHDIGKIGVPESALCKPGRLTAEEYESIKKHPGIGAKILGGIRQLDDVIDGILCHHERPDGKGYPRGISGDQMSRDARIIGLADCFDAMTSDRTYRKALPLPDAVSEIAKCAGTQFDPDIAEKLLSLDLEKFLEELRQPAQTVFPVTISQESAE